jgi:hypothetical protein
VPGHAYSVITVLKTKEGIILLKIRNPWGQFEWSGSYSDNDKSWTKQLLSEVKPVFDKTDGTFWMCFEDFIQHF